MVDLGLVGIGKMGGFHYRVLSELKNCNIKAICDTNEENKKKLKGNEKFYTSIDEMLENEKLDCVDVCSPTQLHEEHGLKVLDHDLDLFVEKPIAFTFEGGKKIVEKAKEKDKILMVGHIERFNPAVVQIKKLLKGKGKDIVSMNFTRVGPVPAGESVIIDIGTHDLDLSRYLSESEVEKIFAVTSGDGIENAAQIMLKMRSGASSQLTLNWLTPYKVREIEVVTKTEVIDADLTKNDAKVFHDWIDTTPPSYKISILPITVYKEPLRDELVHFLECVEQHREPVTTGHCALRALELAEKAIESAKTGKVIELPEPNSSEDKCFI